uniref:Piezo TM1-24 domain-containing protein n=1 Tax=Strongyloides venezuelensis TaxID=75913 RepID=A0A0K0FX37_STRVS
MMSNKVINIILYNIFLPIILVFASCARINLRDLVYLIFLLLQPQSTASIYDEFRFHRGDYHPKLYIFIMWLFSFFVIIAQTLFNILHFTNISLFGNLTKKKCDFWNYQLRQIGLEEWSILDNEDLLYIILPDILVLGYTSLLLLIIWFFPKWYRNNDEISDMEYDEVKKMRKNK